jgi:hypothetical protein
MAGQYNSWRGEPSGFEEVDARGVGWGSGGWGHRPNPPDRNGGWAPYRSRNRGRSFETAQQRQQTGGGWDDRQEAEPRTGAGWGSTGNDNATQLHRQTGGGWGNRQLAEERAREGWGRPNTDHTSRHTRPSTSGYRSYIDNNKPLTSTDATRNTETEEEEREKWTTLSTMGGGLDLMEEFKCGICHEMLRRPCLSLNCAHRFCEECITKWIERNPSCPECRSHLPENKLRYDRCVANIIEKVVLLRWPGQSTPHE